MSLNNMQNKLICVFGLGQSGIATARYLQRTGQAFFVVDSRANPPGQNFLVELDLCDNIYLQNCPQQILNNAAQIIASPGVSPDIEMLKLARAAGVEIVGDIEMFVQQSRKKIVAITGSNGKSTVTDLTCKLLCAAGYRAQIGGNFGVPVLDFLPQDDVDIYVLELSSFQLDTTVSLRADVAVVLNVTEDHMDRYVDLESYRNSKLRIYENAKYCLINADDAMAFTEQQKDCDAFSLLDQSSRFHIAKINHHYWLVVDGNPLVDVEDLSIAGSHNWSNLLAALGILRGLNVEIDFNVITMLKQYHGLAHRFELIQSTHEVDWINDSKATNVGATLAALAGVDCNYYSAVVLIAGGMAKDADLSPLKEMFEQKVSQLILMGVDAKLLAQLFDSKKTSYVENMQQAVNVAKSMLATLQQQHKKVLVLLSPACASLDMFKNFEARGKAFVDAVEASL